MQVRRTAPGSRRVALIVANLTVVVPTFEHLRRRHVGCSFRLRHNAWGVDSIIGSKRQLNDPRLKARDSWLD